MCPLPRDVIVLTSRKYSTVGCSQQLFCLKFMFCAGFLWFTSWQVLASIIVSVLAALTHTCHQFTFHRFKRRSLKPIWLGGSSRDSQWLQLSGRPLPISHCWFICWMPPYMSWDSKKEADVALCGWREHTSAFSLLQIRCKLKYVLQEFNLLVQNKREVCATLQNFALCNT